MSETRHRGAITVCVMLATIMQALDMTIANVALPFMQGSLNAGLDQINWVLTSYIVATAIMMPLTGWMVARFGRKQVFLFTVAGFTVSSMLCGMAGSLEQMVVFRLLQGVFGAPLVPLSQTVLLDSYPREKHGQATALWGVGIMVGPIMGPTLGGWLTEYYNWRWVFYINLPIGLLTLAGLGLYLTESPRDKKLSFDWFGFLTLSLAIGALQMMLDRGEQLDWFASTEIVVYAALCALGMYLFLVHTFTVDKPFLDREMFIDRNFSMGLIFIFLVGVLLLATMALLTPFLQNLLGYPVLTAGLLMGPRGIGTMIGMFMVGRMINLMDPRLLVVIGLALTAWSLHVMSEFSLDVTQWQIIWSGLVQGLGLGLLFVPLSIITFATLEPRFRTQGSALFSLTRSIGSSLGISLVIFMLGRNTQIMHATIAEHITPFNPILQFPNVAAVWNMATEAGRMALNHEITRQATMIGFINDFRLMMYVSIAAMPLVLILRKPRHAEPDDLATTAALE
ncbi:MAG: DHA2 family efflux MFS transporter permease subunit [Alphaproteobacteria bacterium]